MNDIDRARVDVGRIRRHIETIAGFTATPGAGSTRLSYTGEYRQACDYLAEVARERGLPPLPWWSVRTWTR